MDNTALELASLKADRDALRAFGPWGSSLDLFRYNVDPNLISEELKREIIGHSSSLDLPSVIWFLSSDALSEEDLKDSLVRFGHPRSYGRAIVPEGIDLIGHQLVSNRVRALALSANSSNAEYLSQDQLLELWKDLSSFTVAGLIESGYLKLDSEIASTVLQRLVDEDPGDLYYGKVAQAFDFENLQGHVASTDQLSALVRGSSALSAEQIEEVLRSPYSDTQVFFEILQKLPDGDLLRALELGANADYEGTRSDAQRLLELKGAPLLETPDPQLVIRARNSRRRLKGDARSFREMLEAEVNYRIYEDPYRRLEALLRGKPRATGSDEVNYEISKSVKVATDARLKELAVRDAVTEWLSAFGE